MADLPRMNGTQLKRAKRLIQTRCCNYCQGECLALDDGEGCVCVQSISYSVLCKWFRYAVLPADPALYAEIMKIRPKKQCTLCGKPIFSTSNSVKYCPPCAIRERRRRDALRKRKTYRNLRK